MINNDNLIWIDLEMTGLDPDNDRILELATIVTDPMLNILAEGPVFAIRQSDDRLAAMDTWNTQQHQKSGLVDRSRSAGATEAFAERKTIAFLSQYLEKGRSPMCGNSICQDRRFLCRYMPELAAFFHYRHLDVSSIKELVKRWRPDLVAGFSKESQHLALQDIKDSIAELVYYKQTFLLATPP